MLFDARNGKELGALGMGFELATAMAFSPDGRTLVADGGRQAIHFWDTATGKDRLATPEAHLGNVGALAFSPDGKTLISGSDDRTVRFWDLATGRPTRTLTDEGWVRSLAVSRRWRRFLPRVWTIPKTVSSLESQDWGAASSMAGRE